MNKAILTDAVTALDDDILANAAIYGRDLPHSSRKRRAAWRWGSIAASLAVVVLTALAAVWWFAPPTVMQDELMITALEIDGYVAEYDHIRDLSRAEKAALTLRRGEVFKTYETYTLYRIKGTDDLAYLIREDRHNGELSLLEFHAFVTVKPGDHRFEFEADPPTLAEQWSIIFGVDGAEDIRRVTFSKGPSGYGVEAAVEVPTVVLTEADEVAVWYGILAPLRCDVTARPVVIIGPDSPAYTDPVSPAPLTIQTMRRITVEFVGGRTVSLKFYSTDRVIQVAYNYGFLSEEDSRRLIQLAEIDTTYRNWGTNQKPSGNDDNATSRPRPGNEIETEMPIDMDHMGS